MSNQIEEALLLLKTGGQVRFKTYAIPLPGEAIKRINVTIVRNESAKSFDFTVDEYNSLLKQCEIHGLERAVFDLS